MAFVVVGFALRPRLQHGDRPMAYEIVEAVQDAGDGLSFVLDGDALRQHGLEDADQEKRRKQIAIIEMRQKVGVMGAVGRQRLRGQGEGGLRLAHVAEGGGVGVQLMQSRRQRVEQRLPRGRLAGVGEEGVGVVELLLPARRRAGRRRSSASPASRRAARPVPVW